VRGPWLYADTATRRIARRVLVASQDRLCAVCRTDDPDCLGLVVDHCHVCGYIRGLVCGGCNVSIGAADQGDVWVLRQRPPVPARAVAVRAYVMDPPVSGCECRPQLAAFPAASDLDRLEEERFDATLERAWDRLAVRFHEAVRQARAEGVTDAELEAGWTAGTH
jgi:hypothetical protein